jgi:glycosyltransferase involved in cell wall biosynthesis
MKSSKKQGWSKIIQNFTSFLFNTDLRLQKLKEPKISVITPSYNQDKYLERTILSVLNQEFKNFELIVIDGGSSDSSIDILKKYDEHIHYWVSEKDEGQTNAINKGLKVATGDLLCYQNSDDIFLPGAFKAVADNYLIRKSDDVLIYGDFLHISEHDDVLDEQRLGFASKATQYFLGPQVHNQAAFWSRSLANKIGYFDESYHFDMDYEFFSRILFYDKCEIKYIKKFIGALRHHADSKTNNLQEIQKKESKIVKDIYYQKLSLLKYFPRMLTKIVLTSIKALKHILSGKIGYVIRDRIKIY